MFLLIVVVLMSTGARCSPKKTIGKEKGESAGGKVIESEVYKGKKGLEMDFVKDLPPNKIYSTNELNLLVELRNVGAYAVKPKILISGYDPDIITGIEAIQYPEELEGKKRFMPEGGYTTVQFDSNEIGLPEGTDSYKPKFVVTACYEYGTKANPVVCIDPSLYDVAVEERACEVRSVSMSGGQGAPIEVSSVDVDTIGNKAHFKIHLSNVGGGRVVEYIPCPNELEYKELNMVSYDVLMSSRGPDKCSPHEDGDYSVRLVNGKAIIYCTFTIPNENTNAYSTPLEIELSYGYMQSISKDVEIIRIDE